MDLSREQALSILGLSPSATDEEAARAYTRQKQPVKRLLIGADSVGLKNEYRDRLRSLVRARDAALGRTSLDDRTHRLELDERPLLSSLEVKDLDRARAFRILGLATGARDEDVSAAYTERYRFLTQRLGHAQKEEHFRAIRDARVRLLGVRRFLLERTETLDLTAVFANEFQFEDEAATEGEPELVADERSFFDAPDGAPDRAPEPAETPSPAARPLSLDETDFDPEKTRTSLAPNVPDPSEWEGDADHIRAHFEQLVRPLRENMAAADGEELKSGYERAIAQLQSERDDALRRCGD